MSSINFNSSAKGIDYSHPVKKGQTEKDIEAMKEGGFAKKSR